jgi:hypothetical protein
VSFKVAVVCEDPTLDHFVVKPVVACALEYLGKPRARIEVVTNPHLTGISTMRAKACEILSRYSVVADMVVFVADADCEDGQQGRPDRRAQLIAAITGCDTGVNKAIAVVGVQEIEVWAVWGIRNELGVPWAAVREHCHPKEAFFQPAIKAVELIKPDRGRTRLIERSLSNGWVSIRAGCPELAALEAEAAALV